MTEDSKNNPEIDLTDEADVLKSIDQYLAEEDPDFFKTLSEVKIDNTAVNLSVLDQALELQNQKVNAVDLSLIEKIKIIFDFRNNFKTVFKFWCSVVIVTAALWVIFQSRIWDKSAPLFLLSYADWGVPVQDYNPSNEVQLFFDNSRLAKNILELKKMVVNLKPSNDSSDNPMLAFEIRVEGLSTEVMVELKDRESEFVDRVLRVTEDFSYDELADINGKKKLSDRIIEVMNTNLTKGQVRKVMYSSFFLKN